MPLLRRNSISKPMKDDYAPVYFKKSILVFGCGNILFGDDGFGPAVIEHFLEHYEVPEDSCIISVGTSVRKLLFDIMLTENKPEKLIIVDAVDKGRGPGEIFEISVDEIPENKIDDFSMHQIPTSNMLKELKEFCNIDVKIFVAQTEYIPDEVGPGLSVAIRDAVPKMCELVNMEMKRNRPFGTTIPRTLSS